MRLFKPWYVWRPWQLVARLRYELGNPRSGYGPNQTAWGVSILADPRKTIGRSIRTTGVYDLAVSEVMARLVRQGDTVVDAGANVGYMTLLAAIAAGPSGRVTAWEPHPELFGVLQNNVWSLSGSVQCASVTMRNAALGETSGAVELNVPPGMATNDGLSYVGDRSGSDTTILVDLESIDETFGDQSISILKLDVEGSELAVLRGASRLLRGGRIRDIVFEDHLGRDGQVIPLLVSLGYEVFSIGWSVAGPRLGALADGSLAQSYEAPSYLATRASKDALRLCREGGWLTLRRGFAVASTARRRPDHEPSCA